MPHGSFFMCTSNEANYYLSKKRLIFIVFEKTRQIFVNFFMQSRKRLCKEKLLSRSSTFTWCWQTCHLWLLRLSFVAFDLVICGILAAHLQQVRASKHSSDNPKSIAFTHSKDVKKTEVFDNQRFPKTLIFRTNARKRIFFSTEGLLVRVKFRIIFTILPFLIIYVFGSTKI